MFYVPVQETSWTVFLTVSLKKQNSVDPIEISPDALRSPHNPEVMWFKSLPRNQGKPGDSYDSPGFFLFFGGVAQTEVFPFRPVYTCFVGRFFVG